MSNKQLTGRDLLKQTVQRIKRTDSTFPSNYIEEMTLPELLEAERKFLAWYPKTKHKDKEVKKHIYETYIKPRIENLQWEKEVREAVIGPDPVESPDAKATQQNLLG